MKETTLEIDGQVVDVSDAPCLPGGEPTPAVREFAAELVRRLDEARAFAAQELLSLYNENWRPDADPVLDEREFCSRLIDPSVELVDVGEATIFFDPSGMFTDHVVEVWFEGGRPAGAEIQG